MLGGAFLLSAWWLWPLPRLLATHSSGGPDTLPGFLPDHHLILWALAWDTHALATQPWALFHANTFHPAPLSLAFSEHVLGYLPLFAPAYWLSGNAVLAGNLTAWLSFPFCAAAMYALCRRFTGPGAATIGAILFAFAAWRSHYLLHLHMTGVQYLPAVLFFTERWLDEGQTRDAIGLGLCASVQLLSSYYLAYALVILYGPYLMIAGWRWRRALDRRRLLGLVLTLLLAGVPFVAASIPYLELRRLGMIPNYLTEDAGPAPLLRPLLAAQQVWPWLRAESVGPLGYLLAVLGLLGGRRNGGLAVAIAAVIAGWVTMWGDGVPIGRQVVWSPYALLLRFLPGFTAVRIPTRFFVVTHLGLALLAALGAARLLSWLPRRIAPAGALGLTAIALWSIVPSTALGTHLEATGASVPPAYRWLARHGDGRPMLELPQPRWDEAARRMLLSTYHWLPIVDGYSGYPVETARYIHGIASGLPSEHALQELVDVVDLGWILVHTVGPSSAWHATLPPGLAVEQTWGDDVLVRVSRPVRADRRDRLLSRTVSLDGTPLGPLRDCPGTLALATPIPLATPSTDVTIVVDVENRGTAPWPAHGLVPNHLVRLVACLNPGLDRPCVPFVVPLSSDVQPGHRLRVGLRIRTPMLRGRYVVNLHLTQVGDGPLAQCGVAPIEAFVDVGPRPPLAPTVPKASTSARASSREPSAARARGRSPS